MGIGYWVLGIQVIPTQDKTFCASLNYPPKRKNRKNSDMC